MQIWRKWMRGCKYLVVRRDGSIPRWPHFVLAAADPAAPAALQAYASKAFELGMDEEYCRSVVQEAVGWEKWREQNNTGDPDKPPHRKDNAGVLAAMEAGAAAPPGHEKVVSISWVGDA